MWAPRHHHLSMVTYSIHDVLEKAEPPEQARDGAIHFNQCALRARHVASSVVSKSTVAPEELGPPDSGGCASGGHCWAKAHAEAVRDCLSQPFHSECHMGTYLKGCCKTLGFFVGTIGTV